MADLAAVERSTVPSSEAAPSATEEEDKDTSAGAKAVLTAANRAVVAACNMLFKDPAWTKTLSMGAMFMLGDCECDLRQIKADGNQSERKNKRQNSSLEVVVLHGGK